MNPIKLICFDLDLTLITHTSWEALNMALGMTPEEDRKYFEYYSSGKITYQEWNDKLVERYGAHEAATRDGITGILSKHAYAEGAKEIVSYLKSKGYIVILISGSMDVLVDMVAKDLGIEYAKANNTLEFSPEGRLVSIRGLGDDVTEKLEHLKTACSMFNVSLDECACVGDGANDIKMFQATGHGITFKGSPIEGEAWKVIETLSNLQTIFP